MCKQSFRVVTALVAASVLTFQSHTHAQDAEAEAEEPPKWEQTAGVGLSITGGNAETVLATADYTGVKKWGNNEIGVGAAGGYGKADGVVNNNFANAFGQYNRLFGPQKRWFGFGRAEARYNEIADIDYRVPVTAGLGYYFLKRGLNDNDKFNLAAEIGPGYVWEKLGGVRNDYAIVNLAQRFSWVISERTRLWQSLSFTPEVTDVKNSVTDFELGLETTIVNNMVFRSVFTDSYRTRPAAGRKKNDFQLISSIAYKF